MIPSPILWQNDVLTIRQLLEKTAEMYKDSTCICFKNNNALVKKSYITMKNDSFSCARYIRSVDKDRMNIAIIGKTDYKFISFFNGIFVSGNVAVPMGYDTPARELYEQIDFADIKMVLYDSSVEDKISEIRASCKKVAYFINYSEVGLFEKLINDFGEGSPNMDLDKVEINPDDCTIMIFTSGTTGKRKAAMLSSRAVISNVYYKELAFPQGEMTLNVLPMHHIFCFSCDYLKNLKDGICIALNGDLASIGDNLLYFQPKFMRMVPMIIESLVRKAVLLRKKNPDLTPVEAGRRIFGERLDFVISAGAALGKGVAEEMEKMGITVRQGYGMTETGPRISVANQNADPLSGGIIIDICNVRIQNGEIQVQSPSLMMGYYKNPEATEAVYTSDGWFRTGDIGRISDKNELFITGRFKNVIILSNGENISPEEVEAVYGKSPLVAEIAVYSENGKITADIYPDIQYAQAHGIADIEKALNELVTENNLKTVPAKEVRVLNIVDEPLPRTSSGKIIRKKNS